MTERMIFLKKILRCVLIVAAAALAGLLLMTAVYLIPTGRIRANAVSSVKVFEAEGDYPKLIPMHFNTTLDNWTDATILAEAAYDGEKSLMQRVCLVPHIEYGSDTQANSFIRVFTGESDAEPEDVNYGRYWHGYLLLIKPLMLLTDYSGIRELMGFAQLVMFCMAEYLVLKKHRKDIAAALLFLYAFLNPAAVSMTLNYGVIFFILFGELLYILCHDERYADRSVWLYHFVTVGCMTAFFDYLTYPLVTFGVAMLMLLALYPSSVKADFFATVQTGIGWIFGYVGMWASKWVLGSLISGENILAEAGRTLAMRSAGDVGEDFSRVGLMLAAIYKNLTASKLVLGVTGLFFIAGIVYMLRRKEKPDFGRLILMFAYMAAPLLWYAMAANHSYIHYFFTYRTLGISVFGASMLGMNSFFKKPEG